MSSDASYNIWGAVSGALGIIGLIPVTIALVHSQLPLTKLRILDKTLEETETLLTSVTEEGLFRNSNFIDLARRKLSNFHVRAECFRTDTYSAATLNQQLKEMVKGLSHGISILCEDVKVLRADIATTTDEERKRLKQLRETSAHDEDISQTHATSQFEYDDQTEHRDQHNSADGIVTYLNSAPRPMRQDSIVSTSITLVAYADHENTYVLPVTIWIPAPHPDHDDHAKLTWPPLSSPHFLLREDHTRVISAKVAVNEQDQTGYHSPASKAPRRQAITHTCSRLSSTKGRRRVCRKASSRTPSGENSSRSKDLGHLRYDLQSTSADIDEWEDIDDEVALTLAHYSLRGVASQLYNETAVSGSDNVL